MDCVPKKRSSKKKNSGRGFHLFWFISSGWSSSVVFFFSFDFKKRTAPHPTAPFFRLTRPKPHKMLFVAVYG